MKRWEGQEIDGRHDSIDGRHDTIDGHSWTSSGALTFSPPTFSPIDNSTHTVGPSDNWTLEHFDPHLFGPCIV